MTDKNDTNHVPDDNYCNHDDVETWQIDTDLIYFKENYRNQLVKKGKQSDLLEMHCIKCTGQMLRGMEIMDEYDC